MKAKLPVTVEDILEDDTVTDLIRLFDTVSHNMFIIKHVTIVKVQILYVDHKTSWKIIQRVIFTRFL